MKCKCCLIEKVADTHLRLIDTSTIADHRSALRIRCSDMIKDILFNQSVMKCCRKTLKNKCEELNCN